VNLLKHECGAALQVGAGVRATYPRYTLAEFEVNPSRGTIPHNRPLQRRCLVPAGKLVALYAITTLVFFALDFVWLSTATARIYQPYLGDLLLPEPKLAIAAAFYLFYVVGILALAVVPGLQEGALVGALWRGALFGFLAYATYDLTNLATIQGWAWQVSVIDMIWGTVLNTTVAAAGYFAGRWLGLGG
jgi:uncharacterized membrane protein